MATSVPLEIGQRVSRRADVFDEKSPLMYGYVVRRYSQDAGINGVKWHDPEVYEVHWEHDAFPRRGYFRHGLQPVSEPSR